MYYHIEKCKEDGIITLEEINGFRKLMEEYKLELTNKVLLELSSKENLTPMATKQSFGKTPDININRNN